MDCLLDGDVNRPYFVAMATNSQEHVADAAGKLSVERAFAYYILRTSRLLRFHFQAMTSELGIELSPEQWLIINRLTHQDGLPQSELIDATFKDRANTSRMLASLEKKGLIRRRQDKRDARRYCIFLTAKGRKCHEQLVPAVHRERAKVYDGLNDEDFDHLKRILDTIDDNILQSLNLENQS